MSNQQLNDPTRNWYITAENISTSTTGSDLTLDASANINLFSGTGPTGSIYFNNNAWFDSSANLNFSFGEGTYENAVQTSTSNSTLILTNVDLFKTYSFNPTSTKIIRLPLSSTCKIGSWININNFSSTSSITIQDSTGTLVYTILSPSISGTIGGNGVKMLAVSSSAQTGSGFANNWICTQSSGGGSTGTGGTGFTGNTGPTGPSQWINTSYTGPTGGGYTGIGYTGDVMVFGKLYVQGGIDPTYLALTPQSSVPTELSPGLGGDGIWIENGGALRVQKMRMDNFLGASTKFIDLQPTLNPQVTLSDGLSPSTEVTLNNNEINLIDNSITTTTTFDTINLSQTKAGPTTISATWEDIINGVNAGIPTYQEVLTAGNTATDLSANITGPDPINFGNTTVKSTVNKRGIQINNFIDPTFGSGSGWNFNASLENNSQVSNNGRLTFGGQFYNGGVPTANFTTTYESSAINQLQVFSGSPNFAPFLINTSGNLLIDAPNFGTANSPTTSGFAIVVPKIAINTIYAFLDREGIQAFDKTFAVGINNSYFKNSGLFFGDIFVNEQYSANKNTTTLESITNNTKNETTPTSVTITKAANSQRASMSCSNADADITLTAVTSGLTETVVLTQTDVSYNDGITPSISATWEDIINTANAGIPTLQQVLTTGNQSDQQIILRNNLITPTSTNSLTNSNINLVNTIENKSINIQNGLSGGDGLIGIYNNDTGGASQESSILNSPVLQKITLSATNTSANTKTIQLDNYSTSASSQIVHTNFVDTFPLLIEGTQTGVSINAPSGITGRGNIQFSPNTTNGDLVFVGNNLQKASAGGSSGQYLRIKLNGNYYKIALLND